MPDPVMTTAATHLAMEIPFSSAELRDLAERARRAIVFWDREVERLEEEFQNPSPELEALAGAATETLSTVACLAGLKLDASFMPSLLRWPRWAPPAYEDMGRYSGEAYFQSLTDLFRQASAEQQQEASNHRLPRVRRALAAALDPSEPGQRALLERLLVDSQRMVGSQARERLGVDSVPWHRCVFGAEPRQLLEQAGFEAPECERALAQLDELAPAFDLKPWRAREHDSKYAEVVPKLPDVLALPVLQYRLQQADYSQPPEGLAEDLVRREGAGRVLARTVATAAQNLRYARLLSRSFEAWMSVASPAVRRDACHCWLEVLKNASIEATRDPLDVVLSLMVDNWSPDDDPALLWQIWKPRWEGKEKYAPIDSLLKAVVKSHRLAELEEPLIEHLREYGATPHAMVTIIDRLLESLPAERRDALIAEGLESRSPGYLRWALKRHTAVLASESTPDACRRAIQKWLADDVAGRVVREDSFLRQLALPELRTAFGRGELSHEEAERVIRDIGHVYGGVAEYHPLPGSDDQQKREKLRTELGAFYDPAGGPPTEAEWTALRAFRRAKLETGERQVPCAMPPGPWHPNDLAVLRRDFARFEAEEDEDEQAVKLIGLHSAIVSKPDPAILPDLVRLHELAAQDDAMRIYAERMAELIEELGGRIEAHRDEPSVGDLTGEWMDEEEEEEAL